MAILRYVHVRCGILHQAETTGGWRIQKSGPIFDAAPKKVGSDEFLAVLKTAIAAYANALRQTEWAGETWVNFRSKMNSICTNCA